MKKFLAILLAMIMVFGLVACDKNDEPAKTDAPKGNQDEQPDNQGEEPKAGLEGKKVAYTVFNGGDPYISTVKAAFEANVQEIAPGVEVEYFDAKGDAAEEANIMDTIVERKFDIVVVNLQDPSTPDAVIQKLGDAGIPYIFYNREPDASVFADNKTFFIGTTAADAGVMQGDLLADYFEANPDADLNGDGKVQYLMYQGEPVNPEAIARTEYSVKQAEERGLKMELLGGEISVCNWDQALARDDMEAKLAAYEGQIEAVLCNNDGMAMGVLAALEAAGYNTGNEGDKFIPVIGVDATDDALQAMEQGKLYGTVKQDGEAMAIGTLHVMKNVLEGKGWVEGTDYEIAADGYSIRIPYKPMSETGK